ncbi:MAG: hypothetical protein JSW52_05415 [Candidatus Coatesbacteria bacterium]|nr:MAG: hypothetical protein JSW52_05415 [Candidatus Coatesbacteria bacterium]
MLAAFILSFSPGRTLTVDGKSLRFAGDYLTESDAEWLCGRIDYYFEQGNYDKAGELIKTLESCVPPDFDTRAKCLRARYIFSAESHSRGYLEFRGLYEAEVAAFKEAGLVKPDAESSGRFVQISETIIDIIRTPLRTGYGADVSGLPRYASPTLHTGVADTHAWVYDLRWSVNFVYLINKYDPGRYSTARDTLKKVINEKRNYIAYYKDHSLPKSTKDRAADEIVGSVTARGAKMLPGAIGREIHRSYNFEGFKLCLPRQISIRDLASFAVSVTTVEEPEKVKIITYTEDGYVGYVGEATCKAEAQASVRDVLAYFHLDPYAWHPYLGKVSGEPDKKPAEEQEEGTEAADGAETPTGDETTLMRMTDEIPE